MSQDPAAYFNRTYDVSAFAGATPAGEVLLDPALAEVGLSGDICTGTVKLAQRFVIELLTAAGSLRYLPDRGTNFLPTLRSGRARNETDVFAAFALAVALIDRAFASDQRPSDPPDEVFAGAELVAVAFVAGGVRLSISLATAAGTARPIILPIPIVI